MNYINLIQWPAMIVTLAGAWLVASSRQKRRQAGFWIFLLSNALWVTWGLYSQAPGLIALQLGLATMNIRGALKNGFGEDTA